MPKSSQRGSTGDREHARILRVFEQTPAGESRIRVLPEFGSTNLLLLQEGSRILRPRRGTGASCMTVILIFLTIVVLIIFFFREVVLTLIALAGFLLGRLADRTDLLKGCVHNVWESLASPPVSLGGALVLCGYFVFVLLVFEWLLRAGRLSSRSPEATAQRSPAEIIVDLARLEARFAGWPGSRRKRDAPDYIATAGRPDSVASRSEWKPPVTAASAV